MILAPCSSPFPKAAPFGGGLDKLEFRLPNLLPMRREFSELVLASKFGERKPAAQPSRNYQSVIDLRPEYPALLHMSNKHSQKREHKIEILEVGRQTFDAVVDELSQMFDVDPLSDRHEESFGTMRVDLAVDLPGIPVAFFRERTRVEFKRFGSQIGKCGEEWQMMGTQGIQTIMSGKRPNCYRVYDKGAKWRADYATFLRNWRKAWGVYKTDERTRDAWLLSGMSLAEWWEFRQRCEQIRDAMPTPPSFAELYGIEKSAIHTRVERQMSSTESKDVDSGSLRTMRKLRAHVRDFNPFSRLVFVDAGTVEPVPSDYPLQRYLAGQQLRYLIQRDGYFATVRWITRHSKGNTKRLLESLADFIPCSASESVTAPALFERYRDAIARQLAA
jgi:hypothetical protein